MCSFLVTGVSKADLFSLGPAKELIKELGIGEVYLDLGEEDTGEREFLYSRRGAGKW